MNKSFKDMTLLELEAEYKYWNDKITNATSWGGALTAASEFRYDCARHIKLRKLENKFCDALGAGINPNAIGVKHQQITSIMDAG